MGCASFVGLPMVIHIQGLRPYPFSTIEALNALSFLCRLTHGYSYLRPRPSPLSPSRPLMHCASFVGLPMVIHIQGLRPSHFPSLSVNSSLHLSVSQYLHPFVPPYHRTFISLSHLVSSSLSPLVP